MIKILQINITANWGSHGRIAEGIGLQIQEKGWQSYIAYGRWMNPSLSKLYRIGSDWDERLHGVISRIFDNQGLLSKHPTKQLIAYIQKVKPDLIHLHNIHGYYINYPILFEFLKQYNRPVVWTLHDCWTFTGHCAHYMFVDCKKWQTHCKECPLKSNYPKSILMDRSYQNFENKRKYFLSVPNLTLVTVSKWLENDTKKSFFKNQSIVNIYNGIDLHKFIPQKNEQNIRAKYNIPTSKIIILGVASNWYRKGLDDFIQLRQLLDDSYTIILVGLKDKELKQLSSGIIGIKRTENQEELSQLYSAANVYVNLTREDNFPTTNLEAMACGTPVITYNTGGSQEAITPETGIVCTKGNIEEVKQSIINISQKKRLIFRQKCRKRAEDYFDRDKRFRDYIELYEKLIKK